MMNSTQHTISAIQKRNRTISVCSSSFTGIDPRKGWRTPLNENRYSEQHDEETGLSYCIQHRSLFRFDFSGKYEEPRWGSEPRHAESPTPHDLQRYFSTGLSYFGARYYDADLLTGWLSVDPMADKYPSLCPYNYCAGNPVKLVDPDGNDILGFEDEWKYNTTTGMLSWVSDKGGKDHQTVNFVEGVGKQETLNKSVSFDGQIQEMFDFSVISNKADKVMDGGMQMVGGMFSIGGGIFTGCGSGGFAAPIGAGMVSCGLYQFIDGLHNMLDGIIKGGVSKYDIQNTVKEACITFSVDVASNGISSKMTPRSLIQSLSKTGKFFTRNGGWSSMTLGLAWTAMEVGNMLIPELKCENPRGAKVTMPNSTNRFGRGVGLMPY